MAKAKKVTRPTKSGQMRKTKGAVWKAVKSSKTGNLIWKRVPGGCKVAGPRKKTAKGKTKAKATGKKRGGSKPITSAQRKAAAALKDKAYMAHYKGNRAKADAGMVADNRRTAKHVVRKIENYKPRQNDFATLDTKASYLRTYNPAALKGNRKTAPKSKSGWAYAGTAANKGRVFKDA